MGINHCISLNETEEKQLSELKKEGYSLMEIVRAGLSYYLNNLNIKPQIIKTKEQASEQIKEIIKEKSPEGQKNKYNTYGCGCEKEPGNMLCSDHKRV